ncbi:MAG: shikimate kinase [Balneolaceae bacterium]
MNLYRLEKFKGSIFVCGFMASGKSTVGKEIAKKLKWDFRDLDTEIEQREGKKIRDIFNEEGEKYFREKEREYLMELSKEFRGILSLGGGALQDQYVVDQLKMNGLLLFIDAPLDEIVERVYRSNNRPILFDKAGKIKSKETLFKELKALYSARIKFYKQAQVSIKTPLFTSVDEMTEAAIEKISRYV